MKEFIEIPTVIGLIVLAVIGLFFILRWGEKKIRGASKLAAEDEPEVMSEEAFEYLQVALKAHMAIEEHRQKNKEIRDIDLELYKLVGDDEEEIAEES